MPKNREEKIVRFKTKHNPSGGEVNAGLAPSIFDVIDAFEAPIKPPPTQAVTVVDTINAVRAERRDSPRRKLPRITPKRPRLKR